MSNYDFHSPIRALRIFSSGFQYLRASVTTNCSFCLFSLYHVLFQRILHDRSCRLRCCCPINSMYQQRATTQERNELRTDWPDPSLDVPHCNSTNMRVSGSSCMWFRLKRPPETSIQWTVAFGCVVVVQFYFCPSVQMLFDERWRPSGLHLRDPNCGTE